MGSGLPGLGVEGCVQGVDIRSHGIGVLRHIAVGQGIGVLGLVACTGAYQVDEGMFEFGVIVQKGFVLGPVLLYDKSLVLREPGVQKRFLFLDLLNQEDHSIIICSYNVA